MQSQNQIDAEPTVFKVTCPKCMASIDRFIGMASDGGYAGCPNCGKQLNVARIWWIQLGIDILGKDEIRCAGCGRKLGNGKYSKNPQEFQCRDCNTKTTFQRI